MLLRRRPLQGELGAREAGGRRQRLHAKRGHAEGQERTGRRGGDGNIGKGNAGGPAVRWYYGTADFLGLDLRRAG